MGPERDQQAPQGSYIQTEASASATVGYYNVRSSGLFALHGRRHEVTVCFGGSALLERSRLLRIPKQGTFSPAPSNAACRPTGMLWAIQQFIRNKPAIATISLYWRV
jgi:hypothetical protein